MLRCAIRGRGLLCFSATACFSLLSLISCSEFRPVHCVWAARQLSGRYTFRVISINQSVCTMPYYRNTGVRPMQYIAWNRIIKSLVTCVYVQCESKKSPRFSDTFHKRLGIFSPKFYTPIICSYLP